MTLKEIRDEARQYARDTAEQDTDRLWPDVEMNRYINDVYYDLAEECRLIRDASSAFCSIAMTDEVPAISYTLNDCILEILNARLLTKGWTLRPCSVTKFQADPLWDTRVGMATEYALDYEQGKLTLNYLNDYDDTIQLQVVRLPVAKLAADGDIPEIPIKYHRFFLHGVLAAMYGKQDSDAYDADRLASFTQLYAQDKETIKRKELRYELIPRNVYPLGAFI